MNKRYTPATHETHEDVPFHHFFWERKRLDTLLIPLAKYWWRNAPMLTEEDKMDFTAEYIRRVTYYRWLDYGPWQARWEVFFGGGG